MCGRARGFVVVERSGAFGGTGAFGGSETLGGAGVFGESWGSGEDVRGRLWGGPSTTEV